MAGIREICEFTASDTGKTYRSVDGEWEGEVPRLWAVDVEVKVLNQFGGTGTHGGTVRLVVEDSSIARAGALPSWLESEEKPVEGRSLDDLVLELLETVGVYPAE